MNEETEQYGLEELAREMQAGLWALILLSAETALAFRVLRDQLIVRRVLLPEDEEIINKAACQQENLGKAYAHIERAFREKFQRVRVALENPDNISNLVYTDLTNKTVGENRVKG